MSDRLFHYYDRVRSFLELRWLEKHLTWEEEIPKVCQGAVNFVATGVSSCWELTY